jgi:hypothetical protein
MFSSQSSHQVNFLNDNSGSKHLKRKRFYWPHEIEQEELSDEIESVHDNIQNDDSNSISSTDSSSVSSSSSAGIKAHKIKHGHKILITEEKINEAMHDLQLEIDRIDSADNALCQDPLDDNSEKEDTDQADTKMFLVSSELKSKLKEFYKQEMLKYSGLKKVNNHSNNLQVVLWSPPNPLSSLSTLSNSSFISSSSSEDDSNSSSSNKTFTNNHQSAYKVEEPPCEDRSVSKKKTLKRKFSQLNKITIEEICVNGVRQSQKSSQPIFYLVDEDESEEPEAEHSQILNQQQEKKSDNVKIVECPDSFDEESMDF